jgi:hypothetical protein
MQKSYLLLRHNKQSGPYSLEELTQMALQANDLVWIIGHSAGWRYPEEIDSLKVFMQGATAPLPTTESKGLKEEIISQHSITKSSTEKVEPQSERHIYVSLPAKPVITTAEQIDGSENLILSFEERVEKMRQRVAHVETSKDLPQDSEIETKYSRSLEDIKAEYTNWMRKQKRKRKTNVKQMAITATLFLGMLSGVWAVYQYFTRPSESKQILNEATDPLVVIHSKPVQPRPAEKKMSTTAHSSYKATPAVRQEKKNADVLVKLSNKEKIDSQFIQQEDTVVSETLAKTNNSPISVNEERTATTNDKPATVVDQLHIQADYITEDQRQTGVGGLAVAIKNNSDQMMKVVAVDVIYYGEGKTEIERKTLYFSNLHPGQTLTRNAPAHKKAEGAYAQLGLVSSEAGSLFYASNR